MEDKCRISKKKFEKIARWSLGIAALITFALAYHIQFTSFDYNFEDFYPAQDEESAFFYEHRDRFESDNDFILVAVKREKGVFDLEFLNRVSEYSTKISQLEHVEFVRELTSENELFIYPGGLKGERPYIHLDSNQLEKDAIGIFKNEELVKGLIAENGQSLLIFIKHVDFLSKAKSEKLVNHLYELTSEFDFEKVHYGGRTVGQMFYIETMTEEMFFYIGLGLLLVVFFLLVAFRSIWGLLIPQVVVLGSVLWIIGFMGLMNEPINIVLTILPSIMFVVSMSDVIHLVSKYLELLRDGQAKFDAIKIAFKEIGMATFLTSLTTSIGFFTLFFVNVKPIQVFGLYIGIGVLMAFVLTFSTLPFLFYYTRTPKVIKNQKQSFWEPLMRKAFLFSLKKRKFILIVAGSFVLILLAGLFFIESDNYLLDDVKKDVTMKKDFDFIDQNYGGVRPFELAIELKNEEQTFWDIDVLQSIDQLENFLKNEYGVTIRNSLVQMIKLLNRASFSGDSEYFKLPTSKKRLKTYKRIIKTVSGGGLLNGIVDSTKRFTRISGTIPDWGNQKTTSKNGLLYAFIDEKIDKGDLDVTVTGSAHLLDKNMSYLSNSLIKGLSIAILVVALIMGILYRSLRIVLIATLTNLIPLIIIGGIMGWFSIPLKITTAIVFTIAFGIAVDDTIHFLSKFKLELNKGKSKLYALKRTYITTGKAIVLTSAILCSGFILLLFSDFLGTFYMGLMVSMTLFFAVIIDLFLLPILLLSVKTK